MEVCLVGGANCKFQIEVGVCLVGGGSDPLAHYAIGPSKG